jgi:peptidoglycan hydrolase-like protein with peptidoglycan-binding domain
MKRSFLLFLAISICALVPASANDNVRAVQTKLKAEGFYFGEVNGAFSTELSAAMTRYQIRNGLEVTGQLDEETSKALGAEAAVTTDATAEATPSSETWRQLRKRDEAFLTQRNAGQNRAPAATPAQVAAAPATSTAAPATEAAPAPAATRAATPAVRTQSDDDATLTLSTERLRDYVGAFVLAGLDPQVGAELEFFADRVRYYDEGTVGREAIRRSLQSYNEKWPRRRFWIAGDVTAEPQGNGQLRVTFPLRYELANGSERSSGKILKTLVLEETGDDLQIVAVNETKAR